MTKLFINRREFSIGATALLATLSNFPSFAGSKIKVAGIYTQPIQQKWDARLHLALDAAQKSGEIDYVFSEKVSKKTTTNSRMGPETNLDVWEVRSGSIRRASKS